MEKLRIVVVEDEYYVRKGIIQSFDWEKVDCEIVGEAANGKAGIEVVEETKPDLVIVDVEMPVMDGLEMVRHLKSRKCMAEFVFLTAHQQFTYIHSALKLEAMDYLLNPFRFEDLEECIRKVRLKVHKADTPLEEQILFSKELQVKNSYIKNAVTYVRKHYAEEISSVMVAEELDINPAYFCRLFKKETGYTFGQYLTNYRIHVAEGLLNNFDLRINEVAEQVGIPDSNYFSQIFKKNIGMTPKEYQDTRGMSKI